MRARFTQSFRLQAVEKALNRANDVNLSDIANVLGVGYSTLTKWITQSRNQAFVLWSTLFKHFFKSIFVFKIHWCLII